uniref:Uncharacterized protein n=1 Tax=Rhizophora mucronata TaxID=61149 RepID=A0A2P2PC50_RHIMU
MSLFCLFYDKTVKSLSGFIYLKTKDCVTPFIKYFLPLKQNPRVRSNVP